MHCTKNGQPKFLHCTISTFDLNALATAGF
jgi:hypothetical protein